MPDSAEPIYEGLSSQFFGKYRGLVVDNEDPTRRGRLQVQVPAVMGAEHLWALPCVAYAGVGVGLFALPPVGTAVWVEFEGGDPSYPIWVGCFWGRGEIPAADAKPSVKFLRTRTASIRIDDDEGSITIETDGGARIVIGPMDVTMDGVSVTQTANGNKASLSAAGFDVNNGAFSVL